MRPTSTELIASVADALETQVLPAIQDQWAASTVRSAMQLLRHLALRVEREPQILQAEAADLHHVLQATAVILAAPALTDLRALVDQALALPQPAVWDVPAMAQRDEQCLTVVENLLAARSQLDQSLGTASPRASLVAYLERRLLRERELVEPFRTTQPI